MSSFSPANSIKTSDKSPMNTNIIIVQLFLLIIHLRHDTKITVSAQSSPQEVPFRIIWNSPTQVCKNKYNVTLNLSKFGIESNPEQAWRGPTIALFYQTIFGSWPLIHNATYQLNGGIPQRGDLKLHLTRIYGNISDTIPKNFTGLGVIDMEAYLPLWDLMKRQRTSEYYLESQRYFNQSMNISWLNESIYKVLIEADYDINVRKFFFRTMKSLISQRPNGYWGYYGFPRCARAYDTYACDKYMKRRNENMSWFYESSNAFYPSFYMNRFYIVKPENRGRHLIQIMNEALRLSRLRKGGDVPIYNYARYVYDREPLMFLDYFDLKNAIGQAVDMAQNGVIFWGDYTDFGDCTKLASYIENMLGPMALEQIKLANDCSKAVCNGNGRCIRIEFKDRDILPKKILKPYYVELYGKRKSIAATMDLYTCMCYNGWTSDNCNTTAAKRTNPGSKIQAQSIFRII